MMRYGLSVLALFVIICIAGCGGSSSAPSSPPEGGAVITGQLTNSDNPRDFDIYVDGQQMSAKPGADGKFRIENVPAGQHTVSLISNDGMAGAYVNCETGAGGVTNLGDVPAIIGGQIVGMATKTESGGALTPLAGVEVIADPDVAWTEQDEEPVPSNGEDVQFRAFTDERGSYLMPAVPPGSYVVTVNVPGLEQGINWVWVEQGRTAVADFQLRGVVEPGVGTVSGVISGISEDVQQPLEGATVEIFTDDFYWMPIPPAEPVIPEGAGSGVVPPPYRFREFRTITDANGSYSLNVPSGYLNISVWADGYEFVFESFVLQRNEHLVKGYVLEPWKSPPWPDPDEAIIPLARE